VEAVDWKKKHLDALREMELEERRWRAVDAALRRLVARLCAAAMGTDDRLDDQLRKLSAAVRGDVGEAQIQALSDSLADAVRALEREPAVGPAHATATTVPAAHVSPAPPPPAARWGATCGAVDRLLERLAAAEPGAPGLGELRAAVVAVQADGELAGVLEKIAALVVTRADALARERAAAAAMLAQVTERLEEMAAYLATANADRAAARADADTLNTRVLHQVHSLADAAGAAEELGVLRALVAERLEEVASQVRDFHTREVERFTQASERADRMKARIAELEDQARDLHRHLEVERRRARFDALTRVANRAAFDERLADELARWKRFRTPVCLALLDVDRFKAINDTFGHRAGDAALREIAACLDSRRRATDMLARYGGEEFVLLLVGAGREEALTVAETLRERVAGLKFHFRGTPVAVTVSCGVAEVQDGDTAAAVLERADRALYRAKSEGRNRCLAG
jgi:diguanylate cyclase